MNALAEQLNHYPDLERDIAKLKEFAKPLKDVAIAGSIWGVVERIIKLPDELETVDEAYAQRIREEVTECQRLLDEISYTTISQITATPEASSVFKILKHANQFKRTLRDHIGKEIEIGDEMVRVTPEIARALTRYNFSIGTPPLTPRGIDTIEQIMFGGDLKDIYGFRDILGVDVVTFDRLLRTVDRMVVESTHYTSRDEMTEFENEATDFNNLEGGRGFKKAIISGSADTAIRLIEDDLFRHHSNGSTPVETVTQIDDALIERMRTEQRKIFIARVPSIPYNMFTDHTLQERWQGVIGRLIIVEDSQKSQTTSTTLAYSINPQLIESLTGFHVKALGRPANTQMNLRRIIEHFSTSHLQDLQDKITTEIQQKETDGIHEVGPDEARKKEWIIDEQKDYASLKKFQRFIQFLIDIKTGDAESTSKKSDKLETEIGGKAMRYFASALKDNPEYKAVVVPQGGGRTLLKSVGKREQPRIAHQAETFRSTHLKTYKRRLSELKKAQGIGDESTEVTEAAIERAMLGRRSPDATVREELGQPSRLNTFMDRTTHRGAEKSELVIDKFVELLDGAAGANISGALKILIKRALKAGGMGAASKLLERAPFRRFSNKFRELQGRARQATMEQATRLQENVSALRRSNEVTSFELAERLLNEIEERTFEPSLAMGEIGWTFDDVLVEEDFPKRNYLKVKLDSEGRADPNDFERQIFNIEEQLQDFPELFKLYCASVILIINDPNNPTGKVLSNQAKFKFLDVASQYGIRILSDEAYYKQVSKEVKDRQGDPTLLEFYERNRSRFPNPVTIFTTIPPTKWAMGAGRRTGVILTNDQPIDEYDVDIEDLVEQSIDGENTLSLLMDRDTFTMGIATKTACKALERAFIEPKDPATIIDELLGLPEFQFDSLDFASPVYFALIKARNDFDRLTIRGQGHKDPEGIFTRRQYLSDLIDELKNYRLDKQTQRDSIKRTQKIKEAIQDVEASMPGTEAKCTIPEGPFYFCVQLDETETDPALQPFLETIAGARKIDAVPMNKGYVRFSFGGLVDGSEEDYELMKFAIVTDLKLLLQYWDTFKTRERKLSVEADASPVTNALNALFPGGEADIAKTIEEKGELIERVNAHNETSRRKLVFPFGADMLDSMHRIEPGAPADVVTSRNIECRTIEEFLYSESFLTKFNHYLVGAQGKIPGLETMPEHELLARYGGLQFIERFERRIFKDREREIFATIAMEIAKQWFSDDTIKILAGKFTDEVPSAVQELAILGMEKRLRQFILQFLQTFLSESQEKSLDIKPVFQAGYQVKQDLEGDPSLPGWMQAVIGKTEFAGKSVATDPAPEMITGGTARVAGVDRGIFKRDGNGEDAPTSEFFKNRLAGFAEVMNPRDYVCKMVQIGPTQLMLVMHRSYSHYLVEELRLMPQYEIPLTEMGKVKPDAVSFLGIPTKVMGEAYRLGYYFDKNEDGDEIPVSWVDAERITDYMGYLKKPMLTVTNERVKSIGGMPVHGSAVTIVFKNGLRKTAVLKGDSGVGKSETLIAMVEQMIKEEGHVAEVESLQLLAGDMLSLWEGRKINADGNEQTDMYLMGTEEGDFMRMTDIGEDWQNRFRDLIEQASRTNKDHPKNPRYTIPGLCDPKLFLRPIRVNMAGAVNNFEEPVGSAFQENPDPENFIMNDYVRGYRKEKGTSGDQPNIFASLSYSEHPQKDALITKYKEDFDKLLGWKLIIDERGKAGNGILSFNDVPDEIHRAIGMAKDLFVGQTINEGVIREVTYHPRSNEFHATLEGAEGATITMPLDRTIFNQIFKNPIASTYCGNPFMDPRDTAPMLRRFAQLMKSSGVITFNLYSQLAVQGRQFSGPATASQDMIQAIKEDPRINKRFQQHKARIGSAMTEKYGTNILGAHELPVRIHARNLFLLERHEANTIKLVDAEGNLIPIQTPEYAYDPEASEREFTPTLITPEIKHAIHRTCNNASYDRNLDDFKPDMSLYENIQNWDSEEELTYQVMLANGVIRLSQDYAEVLRHPPEIKKAQFIAQKIIGSGHQAAA
jgi:hypothetical protein